MQCLRIVEKYFTNDQRFLKLAAGEPLITAGATNNRLYYLKNGRLRGSMLGPSGEVDIPLVVLPGDLAGLQSFFVEPHKSTATLVADADTTLHWVSQDDFASEVVPERELMPLLTHTMTRRQHLIQVLQEEQQQLREQAAQAERFELLGQFSAGVAHELNNALAVVEQSSAFLTQHLHVQRLRPELAEELTELANRGLPTINSPLPSEVRNLAQRFGLSPTTAGRIIRFGFPEKTSKKIAKLVGKHGDAVLNDCDLAAALHDGSVAAKQAAAVVASMRSLGARQHAEPSEFDLKETIDRAQIILRTVLSGVDVAVQTEPSSLIGHAGAWVQIWSNLRKCRRCDAPGQHQRPPNCDHH